MFSSGTTTNLDPSHTQMLPNDERLLEEVGSMRTRLDTFMEAHAIANAKLLEANAMLLQELKQSNETNAKILQELKQVNETNAKIIQELKQINETNAKLLEELKRVSDTNAQAAQAQAAQRTTGFIQRKVDSVRGSFKRRPPSPPPG